MVGRKIDKCKQPKYYIMMDVLENAVLEYGLLIARGEEVSFAKWATLIKLAYGDSASNRVVDTLLRSKGSISKDLKGVINLTLKQKG